MEESKQNSQEPQETTVDLPKLTVKQRRFIEEYCKHFNATRAAKEAGYSETTAHEIGAENLRKPYIKERIDERLASLTMSADEALLRMSDYARGSFTPFLDLKENGDVLVNLSSIPAQENLHLIKKIKQTKRTALGSDDNDGFTEVTTEIEIHDSKDAVKTILQMHGKLVEKRAIDHTSKGDKIEQVVTVFQLPDNGRG